MQPIIFQYFSIAYLGINLNMYSNQIKNLEISIPTMHVQASILGYVVESSAYR